MELNFGSYKKRIITTETRKGALQPEIFVERYRSRSPKQTASADCFRCTTGRCDDSPSRAQRRTPSPEGGAARRIFRTPSPKGDRQAQLERLFGPGGCPGAPIKRRMVRRRSDIPSPAAMPLFPF